MANSNVVITMLVKYYLNYSYYNRFISFINVVENHVGYICLKMYCTLQSIKKNKIWLKPTKDFDIYTHIFISRLI